jgi:hypothetical protein
MSGILFMIYQQWAAVISSISRLFSVRISAQCGTSQYGILQSKAYCCMSPVRNTDLLESVDENFVLKEFPAEKRFTIW